MQGTDVLAWDDVFLFADFRFDRRHGGLVRLDPTGVAIPVPLGSRALDILDVLVRHGGELVSKRDLMAAVWPQTAVEENNLTVQISALRRVLDRQRGPAGCIETVPGRGYRLRPAVRRLAAAEPARVHPSAAVADVAIPAAALANAAARDARNPATPVAAPSPAAPRRTRRWRRWRALLLPLAGTIVAAALALPLVLRTPGTPGPAAALPHLSLVVLPFENLDGDPADDHLVAGIADDLTSDLANLPDTFVIARASADTYKGRAVDPRQVGRELGVRYAVTGSVRRLGTTLRINAQLISTTTGAELWAERFDQDIEDLATGQGEIVARLRGPLGMHVLDSEVARRLRERPANPTAFDLYLRARALGSAPASDARSAEQQALLERALRLQPSLVRAKLALAEVLIDRAAPLGLGLSGDTLDRAEHLVAEAEAAEPDAERTLWMRGYLLRSQDRWAEAIEAFRRLVDAYPNDSHGTYMLGLCLALSGRAEEAVPVLERSIRLNPRIANIWTRYGMMGYALVMLGRDGESIGWTERALAADPENTPLIRHYQYRRLAVADARTGRMDEARAALAEANRLWPYGTVRGVFPDDPSSAANVAQTRHYQDGLRLAGMRDHADEDADFGVAPDRVLHADLGGLTPTTLPGATTIGTAALRSLIAERHPLVIDAGTFWWGRSLPGAVVLWPAGVGGSLSDATETRLAGAMRELTGGDPSAPVVAVGFNAEFFDGRNLALRLTALGYARVYWYRGGREAWEAAGLPETETARRVW